MSLLMAVLPLLASQIKSDETVVFYPTFARLDDEAGHWEFTVHGVIYEPEDDSWRRGLTAIALRRMLGVEKGTPEADMFDRRLRLFMVDNERSKDISVRIGGKDFAAGTSGPNGHFQARVRLPADEVKRLGRAEGGWIDFHAVMPKGDDRRLAGRVQLVGRKGLSLVSDIDDTIKLTQVRQPREMLANTFLRPFRAVPGMAAVYQEAAKAGAAVHYVSGSPWQLYEPLAEFLRSDGFPAGSFHLKLFRLKDSSALNVLGSQEDYKRAQIEPILAAFPERRFVFVGDSGEQDPEIYGRLARAHREQVAAIWIRNVTDEPAAAPRYQKAFEGLDKSRWKVFDKAAELKAVVAEVLKAK